MGPDTVHLKVNFAVLSAVSGKSGKFCDYNPKNFLRLPVNCELPDELSAFASNTR